MFHSLCGWLGILSIVVIASGVVDFGLIVEGQLGPEFIRRVVRVESNQWPKSTLSEGERRWTIQRWIPLPWWNPGDSVGLWTLEDGSRAVPEFGPYHPLLRILYGFLGTFIFLTIWSFTTTYAEVTLPLTPTWPVELRDDRLRGYITLAMGVGLIGWVLYDWRESIQWLTDGSRLLLAVVMILAGIHWSTRVVVATMTEIQDRSKIFSDSVDLAKVKTAEQVVVRTTDGKKRIAGYKLILRDKEGKELYTMSDSLGPAEPRETLWQYLMRKYPMPKAPAKWEGGE